MLIKGVAGAKTIQWIVKLFFIYLVIFTAFRVATVICFKTITYRYTELSPAFWLGLKYDLRWIAFILMPIAVFSIFPGFPCFMEQVQKGGPPTWVL